MEARNCTVTTVSVSPWRRSSRRTCSMMGRFATGSIGLGWFAVIGRSLVPSPPAMTTAFTALPRASRPLSLLTLGHRPTLRWWCSEQSPGLDHVQQGRAPVQGTSPDNEGPTCYLRSLGVDGNMRPQEEQRKRVQQAKRGRLADEADAERTPAVAAQDEQYHGHQQLPRGQHCYQPPRDDGPHRQRDHSGHYVEPIR